jgi:single-stranded DNA-binding protein
MAQEINEFRLVGTIYSIDCVTRQGKKDPSISYNIHNLLIDNNRSAEKSYTNKKGDTKSSYGKKGELVKVEFFNNSMMESFSKGDFVEITGYLSGQEWTPPDGNTKIIQKNSGVFIKHADLDGGYSNHKGKIKVESMSNPDLLKNEKVFVKPEEDDMEGLNDLPFIITALIGIGSLFII